MTEVMHSQTVIELDFFTRLTVEFDESSRLMSVIGDAQNDVSNYLARGIEEAIAQRKVGIHGRDAWIDVNTVHVDANEPLSRWPQNYKERLIEALAKLRQKLIDGTASQPGPFALQFEFRQGPSGWKEDSLLCARVSNQAILNDR